MTYKMGIVEIDENDVETEFEQRDAYINYGCAPISTHDLVNCLVVGGRFEIDGRVGTFLTHEAPFDYLTHVEKLVAIHDILKSKGAKIAKVIFYHHESPPIQSFSNGMTTQFIINLMKKIVKKEFNMEVEMGTYKTRDYEFILGKVSISPTVCEPSLHVMQTPRELLERRKRINEIMDIVDEIQNNGTTEAVAIPVPVAIYKKVDGTNDSKTGGLETKFEIEFLNQRCYEVEVLRNVSGDKVYKCPLCNMVSGTLVVETKNPRDFQHTLNCPNKFSTPFEPEEGAENCAGSD